MTWLLTWLNVSVATLNAMLQLLVIYRYRWVCFINVMLIAYIILLSDKGFM